LRIKEIESNLILPEHGDDDDDDDDDDPFCKLGSRFGWVVNSTSLLFYVRKREPVPI
jgi:hypothetical protein